MTTKQKIERFLSLTIPLLISGIVFYWLGQKRIDLNLDISIMDGIDTIKIVLGIWATLLGFSVTAESILIAVKGGALTNLMITSGHLKTMLFSFMTTNIFLFVCLIAFIPIVLNKTWNFDIYRMFICSLFCSFSSLGISLFYFFIMLSTLDK